MFSVFQVAHSCFIDMMRERLQSSTRSNTALYKIYHLVKLDSNSATVYVFLTKEDKVLVLTSEVILTFVKTLTGYDSFQTKTLLL